MKKFLSSVILFLFSFFYCFSSDSESVFENIDSDYRLRSMTNAGEVFIPETKSGKKILISSYEKKAVRDFYDSFERLEKKEVWDISGARESKPVRIEFFEYEGDSTTLSKKTVLTDEMEESVDYNKSGLPVLSEVFNFVEISDGTEMVSKKYRISRNNWEYDEKNRIISERKVKYIYKNNEFEKPAGSKSEGKKYSYHEDEEIPPDIEVYVFGKVQSRKTYSAVSDYITEMFFDSDYIVKTFYENNERVKEEYFQNGILLRTKVYEKEN